jgi:hypothetical protein
VWICYAFHQIFVWWSFYKAQNDKVKFSDKLYGINFVALVGNLFFIIIHLIQTHLFYDGLAQDVPIWTSQWSVILFLALMLIIDNYRRGFVWGKKLPFSVNFVNWLRKYHGYYFYWAFVYTFWFHPMTGATAQILGFFYMFLLLLQGSLMYNYIHLNKYWTTMLESFVLVHGTMVALSLGQPLWAMFFMGFLGMFIFTYMHGLNLKNKIKYLFLALYFLIGIIIYSNYSVDRILRFEIFWIPFTLYMSSAAIGFIGGLFFKKNN